MAFRVKDSADFLMWQFRGGGVNTLVTHRTVRGRFTVLKTLRLPVRLVTGTSYRFSIVTTGSAIKTYLNGRLVDRSTDATFTAGGIGFRTGRTESAWFDDVTVLDPAGTTVFSNTFDTASMDFPCGQITGGRLLIGPGRTCARPFPYPVTWAFLRGQLAVAAKQVSWAHLYATGSSPKPARQFVYRLSVNGSVVGVGPTQSIRSETRYDGFDVTGLIHPGTSNTVGALAYTVADQRFQALLVVRFADGTTQTLGTGQAWKAQPGGSALPESGSIGTRSYAAPRENINARGYPLGFDTPRFNPARWPQAQPKAPFTQLVATPTGKVQRQLRLPVSVVQTAPGHYFIDYGRTWIGGLALDITGTAGQQLDIRYGQTVSAPRTVRYATAAGNTYRDVWTLRAGAQHLETWGIRVFRYVEVIGAPAGWGRPNFPAMAYLYPYDETAATFASSDPQLNQVWQPAHNTIAVTGQNLFVDSWERERAPYEADNYLQLLGSLFTSADPTLGNYSNDLLLHGRTWPTEWPFYTILAAHEAYQQTGDTAALSAYDYATLRGILPTAWFEPATGLIHKTTGNTGVGTCVDCDLVDWPTTERDGYVFTPYNTVVNALSYRAYLDMADIADDTGHPADAAADRATAAAIKTAVNKLLWDPTRRTYRDGLHPDRSPVDHHAIQAGVFAVAMGIADPAQAAGVAATIAARGIACSTYCAAYLLPAAYLGGRPDVAVQLFTSPGPRGWLNMIAQGAGATMEVWDARIKANTTYSHPWAASPAFLLPRDLFGITATTPGFATFDLAPQPGPLAWAHITVPTGKGRIGAAFHTHDGHTDIAVAVPGNTTARITIPDTPQGTTAYLDGHPTPATRTPTGLQIDHIPPGCHTLGTNPNTDHAPDAQLAAAC
ncbi:hypothetical protein GCM10011594_41590 [Nakamurella endophytica]|uniref:alpha-L-rhamnosidase n=1 Tax=Nakamurella endophytica TaxID=1748367 RepID=A0A917WNF1_9ACTN|nr:hypothetical protein GCM10011594_41590 [Nakamurella endophytica]